METSNQIKARTERNQSASFWLKKALVTAEGRDVLDALYDAQSLLQYCQRRATECGISCAAEEKLS